MPDLLTPRRFPVALTEEQARALEVCARYFQGDDSMGDGDSEAARITAEAIEIVAGVRVEAAKLRARREAIRSAFSAVFRHILSVDPRMPSREARPMAWTQTIREVFR
jgi:hypothetical protein